MGGLLFWYNEEEPGWAAAPPSPLLFVLNVTAHPSTASVPYQLHITRYGTVITGRPEAQPCRVLHLLSGFRPVWATHYSNKSEIWHGANFTFIGAEMWEYSPQNYQIFAFWL